MNASSGDRAIWGIIPAAGLSRRMGFPKQTATISGVTMVAAVAQRMLDAGTAGVVVVTRTELLETLGLPRDDRIGIAINDDSSSQMLDSIRIGLGALVKPAGRTSIDEEDVTVGSRVQSHIRHTDGFLAGSPVDSDGIMVVPADMPVIALSTYKSCVKKYRARPDRIIIATHDGRRGHPIVFPFSVHEALSSLSDGLRSLPDSYPERVLFVEANDPGVLHDMDTPGDIEII